MSMRINIAGSRPNELFKGQDVIVDELKIVSSTGVDFDLRGMYESLNIFEDIYSPHLEGELLIRDGMNLIQHFPIIGQERLHITFYTPGFTPTKVVLEVYGISERIYDPAGKQQIYTLFLTSPEKMLNTQTRVNKAYEGKISEIANDIYGEYLMDDISPSEFLAEGTLHTHKFVIPNKRPVDAINWLATRATSENNPEQANFLFSNKVGIVWVYCNYSVDVHIKSLRSCMSLMTTRQAITIRPGLQSNIRMIRVAWIM